MSTRRDRIVAPAYSLYITTKLLKARMPFPSRHGVSKLLLLAMLMILLFAVLFWSAVELGVFSYSHLTAPKFGLKEQAEFLAQW